MKIKYSCFLFVVSILMTISCGDSTPNYSTNELGNYIFEHEYVDGTDNKRVTNVLIDKDVFEKNDVEHDFIISMLDISLEEAKYKLRYPRSFFLEANSNSITVLYDPDDEKNSDRKFTVSVRAIGENSYGVEDHVYSNSQFDLEGNLLRSF